MKHRLIVVLILVLAVVVAAIALAVTRGAEPGALTYDALLDALDEGRVATLVIEPGTAVHGTWRHDGAPFATPFPVPDAAALADRAAAAGTTVEFAEGGLRGRVRTAGFALQIALVIGLGGFLLIHLREQGLTPRVGTAAGDPATGFEDVAGTQGAAEELQEIVAFLRDPSAFGRLGARVPRGILLVGPPGTGKTLLARAVAGEADVPFLHLSGSEVTGFVVGLGAHRVRSLFARARRRGGVIFIDEVDALGGARGRNRSHNEDDRTLNQLLVEMDGFAPGDGVVVIAATNRPDDLDPALRRPGRFDREVAVGLPTTDGRAAILRLHAERRGVPLAGDVDLERIARLTPGASGADLANLINEAAIAAVRDGDDRVRAAHFDAARDRMLLGVERAGFRAHDADWQTVAVHEAGHALAGLIACPEDGLHKVTIRPRGKAMGVAHFAPDDERHLHSRRYLESQIIKGLGGRAAEEIVFGTDRVTGGAESDLVHANRIARQMVCRLGMGERAGLLVHDADAPLAAETQAAMDDEVRRLLDRLYARTRSILEGQRPALDALARALLEKETLDGDEVSDLLRATGLPADPGPGAAPPRA